MKYWLISLGVMLVLVGLTLAAPVWMFSMLAALWLSVAALTPYVLYIVWKNKRVSVLKRVGHTLFFCFGMVGIVFVMLPPDLHLLWPHADGTFQVKLPARRSYSGNGPVTVDIFYVLMFMMIWLIGWGKLFTATRRK